MPTILEPARQVPVVDEVDICVLGGSCTGVFAAVRAARLGAKVALVEKQNCFGGVATSGLVNIWHSLMDTEYKQQVIAGLTHEVIERLKKRDAVECKQNSINAYILNTEELKIELDELVTESKIKPHLHTCFAAPYVENGELTAVLVENKSGRGAIKAKMFIDATGDGDLCERLGLEYYTADITQPPTTGAKILGVPDGLDELILKHRQEFGLPEIWGWGREIPGTENITFQAITRVFNADCADAESLTQSEIEGRRQIRAIMDIIRKYGPKDSKAVLLALGSYIGVRDTRHIKCAYQLTEQDVLFGRRFEDAIANGTYRVDIHHQEKPGVTFKYLDGKQIYLRSGFAPEVGRWREETSENPVFYQIPYRAMLPGRYGNVIVCGRAIDADKGAFGAVRVMVNLNQTGEAAGVAAYLALQEGVSADKIDTGRLRALLKEGGSIII